MKTRFLVETVLAAPARQGQLTGRAFSEFGSAGAVVLLLRINCGAALQLFDREPLAVHFDLTELPSSKPILRIDAHRLAQQCKPPRLVAGVCRPVGFLDKLLRSGSVISVAFCPNVSVRRGECRSESGGQGDEDLT